MLSETGRMERGFMRWSSVKCGEGQKFREYPKGIGGDCQVSFKVCLILEEGHMCLEIFQLVEVEVVVAKLATSVRKVTHVKSVLKEGGDDVTRCMPRLFK